MSDEQTPPEDLATQRDRPRTDEPRLDEQEGVEYATGRPVEGFPIRFRWQTGVWFELFEKQVELLERDIARAMAEDQVMVFLSTPLSGRGGGHFATNVEIADHTRRRLMEQWGHRFWVLNPGQYQMESKEGTGLMHLHARELSRERGEEIDVDELFRERPPGGGDYMRMWTRILVEDDDGNRGGRWDVIYFLGPTDVRDFFTESGARTWTAGVEEYFARKVSMNREFHETFAPPFLDGDGNRLDGEAETREWKRRRDAFFRYYTIRAGVNFSLGSHDEYNIWQLLNRRRREASETGVADQIAGFFDGRQIDPASATARTDAGYEVEGGTS
ncbi:MAG: hypothetical protein R3199_10020 [Gemmatimonadota bacterium]|nr:hypothetical protein [Gemmatimonadota bacterium]